jgi:ABC-type sugar transport system substrate-binding protein
MDYTRPNLDLVKEGKVFGLVGQPLVEEFRECVHVMDKVLRGEPYNYANPLPAPIITLADIDKYYEFNDMVEAELGAVPTAVPEPTEAPAGAGKTPEEMGCQYGADGKCRVVLVNSFLGNDYRIQMQRSAEAASKYEPYASVIDFSILNTENTPEAQRAGLENLLAEGVDAIVLNAVDNTSVNDLVEKACDMDVKVVTFDITAKPGACEKAIDFGFCDWAFDAGQWEALAAGADKGPINVIMDKGLQGVDIADDIYQCGLDGMYSVAPKENINIVGEYYGEFAEGVQEPLISAILAANPDKKIDVVHTQGYCTTVKSAFENAGLDYLPIMYCQGYNANAVLCTQEGVNCVVQLNSFAGSIGALDAAYRWMAGEDVPNQIPWTTDFGVTIPDIDIKLRTPNAKVSMMETGVNAFPDLPPGFGPLYNWPGAYVQITVEEAAGLR